MTQITSILSHTHRPRRPRHTFSLEPPPCTLFSFTVIRIFDGLYKINPCGKLVEILVFHRPGAVHLIEKKQFAEKLYEVRGRIGRAGREVGSGRSGLQF